MAMTNAERVGKALELLNRGLRPFVERELQAVHGDGWQDLARAPARGNGDHLDTQALLGLLWDQWNPVFSRTLGRAERSLVSELRETRNRWAHQEPFSTDDAYRALDSSERLLASIAADEAFELNRQKQELLRVRFEEQARRESRRAATTAVGGTPRAGLRPWREVITPHPDVASGRYQQAEFAADLGQVHRGEGADEYRDPVEFYRRTFLTEGLRHLLTRALQRLTGSGGDPVVELHTNFGGGKTHSLLALYHLFSGVPAAELAGLDPVLREAGVTRPPQARRAVLVGLAPDLARARHHAEGVTVHTLWGELAWQLGGRDGYALVAAADAAGVSPGSDSLRDLFERFGPCLVLIDEWVAYARQLYGKDSLPAGSFDANLSFAQSLTEAARQASRALVVASIPASDIETGGEAGREALARLRNIFARMESAWRPASAEEGFEIVRRRLFQPLTDPEAFRARDAVVHAFSELYRGQPGEFPSSCREADYERRLQAAYPIHPELFDRLYEDWSSLDRFQRTRGVLRLLAAVIHALWERQDGSLLILPSTIPLDEPAVQFELTQHLDDPWVPVIAADVDGPNSLPLRLDRENPNLGRYSACRRVARALFMGSAPTLHAGGRGLEDRSLKLGCAQPGESVATFGDALRRLTDQATHLYVDGRRYWFSTQPSVTRLAQDRAAQQDEDAVAEEIERRLREARRARGDFARVHVGPAGPADVPDERETRLVILPPGTPHLARAADSPARLAAERLLAERGSGPRLFRNTLVFLAADRTRLAELDQAARQLLAWRSIEAEQAELNLDAFQAGQARTKREQADSTVDHRLPETYCWLLVPEQPERRDPTLEWRELRLQGHEPLAVRASRKLRNDGLLIVQYAGSTLRLELDRVPLWRGNHVELRQLANDFAQYLYLPRLRDPGVLQGAVQDGVAQLTWNPDTFAYAGGWDEAMQRYRALQTGRQVLVALDSESLLVRPLVAAAQMAEESRPPEPAAVYPTPPETPTGDHTIGNGDGQPRWDEGPTAVAPPPPAREALPHRFHGAVDLEVMRLGRDAGTIAEAVVQHLAGLLGADVKVTLEIHAEIPSGAPENVIRTVIENCRTLRFRTFGFEEE